MAFRLMEGIDPKDAANARPLDELLQECEEAAAGDFHRLPDEQRDAWEQLRDVATKQWKSMWAFRGQSRLHRLKIGSSRGIGSCLSFHSSGYRFVHDLDWTVQWWSDAAGQAPPFFRSPYFSTDFRLGKMLTTRKVFMAGGHLTARGIRNIRSPPTSAQSAGGKSCGSMN